MVIPWHGACLTLQLSTYTCNLLLELLNHHYAPILPNHIPPPYKIQGGP